MVGKRTKVHRAPSISDAQITALAAYCPDLDEWPQRWKFDEHDLPPGQRIVDIFTPFLLYLLDAGLSIKTLHRHRDNLWLFGGELIRRRYDDEGLKKMSIDDAIDHLLEEDGGPLIWPQITEAQQNSFDATCRKLFTYLISTAKPV